MIPLRVALKGFMTYREEQTLDFSQSSLWILAGPNGAGKSAIFDAITFALYGQHRGGAQHARDLINHHCDALAVEFDFQIDGQVYRVRRTVPRRGQPTRLVCRLDASNGANDAHTYPIPETESEGGFKQWIDQTIGLDYEAFTSSILLLQGQSDKLLMASPSDRYAILTRLIDLAPYQALYRQADEERRRLDGQVRGLRASLNRLPEISDADLAAARAAHDEAEVEYQVAQQRVENLSVTLEQARQYARLCTELAQRQAELDAAHVLLSRAETIAQGYSRWQELDRVLPSLHQLVRERTRLAEQIGHKQRLERDLTQRDSEKQQAEQALRESRDEVAALEKEREGLQGEADDVTARLADLASQVARLDEVAQVESDLAPIAAQLAELPADIESQVRRLDARDAYLAELERTLPWLEQWSASRAAWHEARRARAEAVAERERLTIEEESLTEQRTAAVGQVDAARVEVERLRLAVKYAEDRYAEAVERCERFAHVSELGKCEWCGQDLIDAHIESERERLDQQQSKAQAALVARQHDEAQASEILDGHLEKLVELDTTGAALAQSLHEVKHRSEMAAGEIGTQVRQMQVARGYLPPAYQARVPSNLEAAGDEEGTIGYPTQADLESLRTEAAQHSATTNQLTKLRGQLDQHHRLMGQHASLVQRLTQLQAALPTGDPAMIYAEHRLAGQRQAELRERLRTLQQAVQAARATAEQARRAAEAAALQYHACDTQLAHAEATRAEMQRGLDGLVDQLPAPWRTDASSIASSYIEQLEQEAQALADYPQQFQSLEVARLSLSRLESDVAQLGVQLVATPTEARRPVAVVVQALEQARDSQRCADDHRRNAQATWVRLDQQRTQRDGATQQLRETEQHLRRHTLLANLLGPRDLQLHLLRQAERTIVDLANDTLNGLSRGTMRLELRTDDETQSDRALDLVVINSATGLRPTAVSLASGSQRFRIAVSLALAVGRYAGQEARRIESVIIDEGFGSLDKYGRDDMVRELDELQGRLARIILVSHQDEFANAFSNGYSIELVDGASQVHPREPW